jgi:hypothetical protein
MPHELATVEGPDTDGRTDELHAQVAERGSRELLCVGGRVAAAVFYLFCRDRF